MKAASSTPAGRRTCPGRPITLSKVALLTVLLGAIANGAQIPIFMDDFDAYPVGSNPDVPPVGEPWQITEPDPEGIAVDQSQRLLFGVYRNTAVAPFSAAGRQLIRQRRNATVTFDYLGYAGLPGKSHYFDFGGYDPASGDPAFFLRVFPQENVGSAGLHDVLYLDPAGGLVDSGIDVNVNNTDPQSVSIFADFDAATYQLDVGGASATLPMFICPDEIVGVEFANYAVAAGSGSIDNLSVSVDDGADGASVPEMATIWMALAGLLAVLGARAARRRAG